MFSLALWIFHPHLNIAPRFLLKTQLTFHVSDIAQEHSAQIFFARCHKVREFLRSRPASPATMRRGGDSLHYRTPGRPQKTAVKKSVTSVPFSSAHKVTRLPLDNNSLFVPSAQSVKCASSKPLRISSRIPSQDPLDFSCQPHSTRAAHKNIFPQTK